MWPPRAVSDALLAEFFRASPRATTAVHRETFWAVRGATAAAPFAGDARWAELYGADALVAAMEWFGALVVAREVGAGRAAPEWLPTAAEDAAADAGARYRRVLAAEVAAFHALAGDSKLPASLRTVALLVGLQQAAAACILVGHWGDMRAVMISAADVLHRSLFPPGALAAGPPDALFEDWLVTQHLLSSVYQLTNYGCYLALAAGEQLVFDATRELPHLRLRVPLVRLATVPAASLRRPGTPTPPELAGAFSGISCADAFGWIDPLREEADDPARVAAVLDTTMSGLRTAGSGHLTTMSVLADYHATMFTAWLGNRGLSLVDLDLAAAPSCSPGEQDAIGAHVRAVLAHPDLDEALRRRDRLRRAVRAVEDRLPAYLGADDLRWERLAASVSVLDQDVAVLVLGIVAVLRRAGLLVAAPDPFDYFRAEAPGPRPPADLRDELVVAWLSSPAFGDAAAWAVAVAEAARAALAAFPADLVAGNVFLKPLDRAAVHAAGFCALVLRHLPQAFAAASEHECARAADLHAAILADCRACLDFMRASHRAELEPVRLVIETLLAGVELRLSRTDMQMLALAQKALARCRHGYGGLSEGPCWTCTSHESRRRSSTSSSAEHGDGDDDGDSDGVEDTDPPAPSRAAPAHAVPPNAPRDCTPGSKAPPLPSGPRRVRFRDVVEVFLTYSPSEYPRSLAPRPASPDGGDGGAVSSAFTISGMLGRRHDMPDLKQFWGR